MEDYNQSNSVGTSLFLDGKEVAKRLNISRAMVYKLVQQGELSAVRIGSTVRVPLENLSKYIDDHLTSR